MPHRKVGIGSILRFGGTVTLNSIVVYVAYNLEKVLLGRFWGAEALGIYGRAYQAAYPPDREPEYGGRGGGFLCPVAGQG